VTQVAGYSTNLPPSADGSCQSRRAVFGSAVSAAFGIASAANFVPAQQALAAAGPPSPEELKRVRDGYDGIVYLLDNWDQQTTTCRDNGGECKRDAEPIRKALGLRSTTEYVPENRNVFLF